MFVVLSIVSPIRNNDKKIIFSFPFFEQFLMDFVFIFFLVLMWKKLQTKN